MGAAPQTVQPGSVQAIVVVWRLDDPTIDGDGRFWMEVPKEAAAVLQRAAGTIIPKGESLGHWRARADGDLVEELNPYTETPERFSLVRWGDEDPERTHLSLSFEYRPEGTADEVDRILKADRERSGYRPIERALPAAVKQLQGEQADLQHQYRDAMDRDDEARMDELSPRLRAIVDELERVDFPHYHRSWHLGRAIREGPSRLILDWTTGY